MLLQTLETKTCWSITNNTEKNKAEEKGWKELLEIEKMFLHISELKLLIPILKDNKAFNYNFVTSNMWMVTNQLIAFKVAMYEIFKVDNIYSTY